MPLAFSSTIKSSNASFWMIHVFISTRSTFKKSLIYSYLIFRIPTSSWAERKTGPDPSTSLNVTSSPKLKSSAHWNKTQNYQHKLGKLHKKMILVSWASMHQIEYCFSAILKRGITQFSDLVKTHTKNELLLFVNLSCNKFWINFLFERLSWC